MLAGPSSRSVNPRLAAASGVMRDTVGAIHNLQHLLGSLRVGPKALARVVPDVHASCEPMIAAAVELGELGAPERSSGCAQELAALVTTRMRELEDALGRVSTTHFRAADRLLLEGALAPVVRDLDGALELVELLVESSATGRVPVALSDVIRESANRPDTSSGRGKRLRVTFTADSALSVRVNPRLALRLFSFAVALASGRDGVHVVASATSERCTLRLTTPSGGPDAVLVAAPALIGLSRKCTSEVALRASCALDSADDGRTTLFTMPLDPGE